MAKTLTFYCWTGVEYVGNPQGQIDPKDGPRPPPKGSSSKYQGATETWWFDEVQFDNPKSSKLVVRQREAFIDKEAAIKWLKNDGKTWAESVISYSLQTFVVKLD
jgi:hypothetical protein